MDQFLKSKAEILVIGIGNEYRGDDGVGPFMARRLRLEDLPRTLVQFGGGEGTSLMESWKDAEMVILLDAVSSGAFPGKTYRFEAHTQSMPSQFFSSSTHNLGVAEAVELARTLDRLPHSLIVYGIEGKDFKEGAGVSPEVKKAAEDVMKRVIQDVQEELREVHRPIVRREIRDHKG